MARPTRGTPRACKYINDRGDVFRVDLLDYIAISGGFQDLTDFTVGGLPPHAKMRHVGLVDPTNGKHFTQPIADEGIAAYNDGGQLIVSGTTYDVTGRIGEHWPLGTH